MSENTIFATVADDGTFVWVDHERGVGRVAVYAGYAGMRHTFVSAPAAERVVVVACPSTAVGEVRREVLRSVVAALKSGPEVTVLALFTSPRGRGGKAIGAIVGTGVDYVFWGDGGVVDCTMWRCRDDELQTG